MSRMILFLMSLILFFSCGEVPRDAEGRKKYTYPEECINGAVYYKDGHKLAPKFNKDGKIEVCE